MNGELLSSDIQVFLERCLAQSEKLSILILDDDFIIKSYNLGFAKLLEQQHDLSGQPLRTFLLSESHQILTPAITNHSMPISLNFNTQGSGCISLLCHVTKKSDGYFLFGDHTFLADNNILNEMTVLSNEMASLTRELRKKNKELNRSQTELLKAHQELKASQSQLLQREKMASIGQLAAGIAHEINNPMGFISGNLRALNKYMDKLVNFVSAQKAALDKVADYPDAEEIKLIEKKLKLDFLIEDSTDLINESLDGAERVKTIVKNLKTFSHVDQDEVQWVDLNETIESTLQMVGHEFGDQVTVETDYAELPKIHCSPQQLSQLFMNLFLNAAQAIAAQGTIKIISWLNGPVIFVSVTDNGCGITEENLGRIFEPFFTTRDVGKGTGLGLSMAYDIVQNHQGEISVESKPESGTTFTIQLPVQSAT